MSGSLIRFKRGNKADLPKSASSGTPLWCEDTNELYIGTDNGIAKVGADDTSINQKVAKSGDTMTGNLNINKSNPCIQLNNLNTVSGYGGVNIKSSSFDYTNTSAPTENVNLDRFLFQDKNGNATGWYQQYFNTSNQLITSIGTRRNINSENKDATLNLYVDSAGGAYFSFPRCTAKAGTSSTASSARVAVIVANYKSGTSWYRVWSDGWIEQGGRTNATSITFLKAFSDTNYCFQYSHIRSSNSGTEFQTGSYSTSGVTMRYDSGQSVWWYACGY